MCHEHYSDFSWVWNSFQCLIAKKLPHTVCRDTVSDRPIFLSFGETVCDMCAPPDIRSLDIRRQIERLYVDRPYLNRPHIKDRILAWETVCWETVCDMCAYPRYRLLRDRFSCLSERPYVICVPPPDIRSLDIRRQIERRYVERPYLNRPHIRDRILGLRDGL